MRHYGHPTPRRVGIACLLAAGIGLSSLAAADTGTAKIRINVREAADLNTGIVTTLNRGDAVEVVGYDGEYAMVKTADGAVGYLKSKYLAIAAAADEPAAEEPVVAAPAPAAPAPAAPAPAAPAPAVAAAPAAPAESATEKDGAVKLDKISVTGSRILRRDLSSSSPITVLSSDDLAATGHPTLEDILQDLPSTLGGADFGSSVNNGNPGLATVQLRGLGPNRTLVLINGHRPAQAGTDGIVDLNTIPTAIIDRVEVLRDGASTIYGSDAIAGVINIITKKDFEGVNLSAGYDVTSESDGEQRQVSLTWGTASDRGNFLVSGSYHDRKAIFQKDRGFSACPLQDGPNGTLVCGGSGTTTPAQIIPSNETGSFVVDRNTGEVRPFDSAADAFNFAALSYLTTPQEVFSLFSSATYNIVPESDFGTVDAYFEGGFTNRESDQLLAPVGTFWGPTVPQDNPLNPFGDDLCAGNPNCSAPQDVAVARRITESGGRSFTQDALSWRLVTGLSGELDNGWLWDLSHNMTDWNDAQRDGGRAVQPRITGLLDPNCTANTVCTPLPAGLTLWDAFNQNTMDAAQVAYGFVGVNTLVRSRMRMTQFNLSGDSYGLFELPGGLMGWAVGFEHRTERAASDPDGGAALNAIFGTPANPTAGSYSVDEFYAEVSLPLVADMSFAKKVLLEGSVRHSDYDFVRDAETTYKVALDWEVVDDFRARATVSTGFRAANLAERFLGQRQTAATYSDPCSNWDTSGDATIIANCGPGGDNLPEGFVANAPQATTLEGGNPNLEPETSDSYTFGIVFTPSAIDGLSLTIDLFNIEIDDAIGTAGTGNVINRCYNSANFSDPLCALIAGPAAVGEGLSNVAPDRRNVQNQVSGVLLTNQNLSSFETAGVDFQIDYGFSTGLGKVDLRLLGSYIDKYNYVAVVGGDEERLAGRFGTDPYNKNATTAFPRLAINTSAGLSTAKWGGAFTVRWFAETDDASGPDCGLSCSADEATYLDFQGYLNLSETVSLTVGARNITDEDPPYVTNYDDMNTLHYSYDTAGTYYYSRLSVDF